MKKILITALIFCLLCTLFTACDSDLFIKPPPPRKIKDKDLKIMTTNYLLYGMTKSVVKDLNTVDFMFKDEQDQWNFNFTDDSVDNISREDLFFYTGGSFEPWMGDFVNSLKKNRLTVVNVSRGTKIISRDEAVSLIYKNKQQDIKDNPYYWLDTGKYKTALFNITKTIENKDPWNKSYYEKNFHSNIKEVNVYDRKLKEVSKKLNNYIFIVQGDELDYFTNYLGLKAIKIPSSYNYKEELEDVDKNTQEDSVKTDKLVFLYSKDKNIREYQDFIKKYNMKLCPITVYQYKKTIQIYRKLIMTV